MKKGFFLTLLLLTCIMSESCAVKKEPATIVCLETTLGKIRLKLYPETAKHKANFLKLVNDGFYNGVLFHRVIADFMIQAGDPTSKTAKPDAMLGSGDVGYTIPAEFVYPMYYHKRGVLAAAREGDQSNPLRASSGCQFYIVQGRILTDEQLNAIEENNKMKLKTKMFQEMMKAKQDVVKRLREDNNQMKLEQLRDDMLAQIDIKLKTDSSYKFTTQQRNDYKTVGGTPHLDGEYTVFGEVVEGMDVVDKISKVAVGNAARPIQDVKIIKAEVEK